MLGWVHVVMLVQNVVNRYYHNYGHHIVKQGQLLLTSQLVPTKPFFISVTWCMKTKHIKWEKSRPDWGTSREKRVYQTETHHSPREWTGLIHITHQESGPDWNTWCIKRVYQTETHHSPREWTRLYYLYDIHVIHMWCFWCFTHVVHTSVIHV